MKVLIHPNESLRRGATTVIPSECQVGAEQLRATMDEYKGLGLAAPQIGSPLNLFVFACKQFGKVIGVANPDLMWIDDEAIMEEACLSVPGMAAKITRPAIIYLRYYDVDKGKIVNSQFEGMDARVIQHEMDHLNGVLYFDHLSSLKKRRFLKRYEKLLKQGRIPKY